MGYKVKRIMVGDKQVRPKAPFTPGANTVAYFPFKDDLVDHSTNNISMTTAGTVSLATSGNLKYASFSGAGMYSNSSFVTNYLSSKTYTINCWFTCNRSTNYMRFNIGVGTYNTKINMGACTYSNNDGGYFGAYAAGASASGTIRVLSGWNNVCLIVNGNTGYVYVNGALYQTLTGIQNNSGYLSIGYTGSYSSDRHNGNMSEVIVENKVWTATDIQTYYNQTKSNYGL